MPCERHVQSLVRGTCAVILIYASASYYLFLIANFFFLSFFLLAEKMTPNHRRKLVNRYGSDSNSGKCCEETILWCGRGDDKEGERCIWSAICLWHRSKKKSLVPVLETKLLRSTYLPTHTGCFILWRQKMSSVDIIPYCRLEGQKNRTCQLATKRGALEFESYIIPAKMWRAQNALWNSGKSSMNDVVVSLEKIRFERK